MELTATIEALDALAGAQGAVDVYTDSTYVIRGITQWSWAWRTRGWKTAEGEEVSHSDLWKNLIRLLAARGKENPVRWHYVRGHTGVPGNERADEIAVSFTKSSRINLYSGPLLKYDIPVFDIPEDTSLPPLRERESGKSKEKATPYSYLSLVNGELRRHPTWKDCEARVKGRPGAKFKKAMTEAEEKEILRTWGIS
jgi:ribonuclease HI